MKAADRIKAANKATELFGMGGYASFHENEVVLDGHYSLSEIRAILAHMEAIVAEARSARPEGGT